MTRTATENVCGYQRILLLYEGIISRCTDRTEDDLEMIYAKLRSMPPFSQLHPVLLQQLAYYGYYEDIDAGVTRKFFFVLLLIAYVTLIDCFFSLISTGK